MDSLTISVRKEYERWKIELAKHSDPVTATTLCANDVLRAHFLIVDEFYASQEGLGGIGPRSIDLLFSSVNRQHTSYGWAEKWTNDFERCATLLYGLVKGHPFHDANKRTALLCLLYHLDKLGRRPTAQQRDFEELVVALADNGLENRTRFAPFQRFGKDAEVKYVADFLKKCTQENESKVRMLRYYDLNTILKRYGYSLENPNKNYIDIVRWDTERSVLGIFGKPRPVQRKVGQVGFPGWKTQVSKGDLRLVRRLTKTDGPSGIDTASFYFGVDTIPTLIQSYWGPLQRLANR